MPADAVDEPDGFLIENFRLLYIAYMPGVGDNTQICINLNGTQLPDKGKEHMIFFPHQVQGWDR